MIDKNITIGIVTYNRAKDLEDCLESIKNQSIKPREVIIADSSEDMLTRNAVKKIRGIKIVYYKSKKRIFQPEARNIIIKKTKTDIIAFLDDDVICDKKWLENIKKGYTYKDVVGVGGPAINCDENLKPIISIDRSANNQNYFTSYGDMRDQSYRWIPPKPIETRLMIGANMSFLRDKLKAVGGFDEFYKFCAFREETDPQIPLIKGGYKFMYMPEALVFHKRFSKGGIRSAIGFSHHFIHGLNHKHMTDKYFPKWKTRLSWIFWSLNPPALPLCIALAILKRDFDILRWHKGLWFG